MKDKLKRIAIKEGGLSLTEFLRTFHSLGITESDTFVVRFYALFDSEKREWIDFKVRPGLPARACARQAHTTHHTRAVQEFAIYSALVGRPRRDKKIEYAFRTFDRDGSGALNLEEFTKLVKAVARVMRRCAYVFPGITPSSSPRNIPSFELSSGEKERIAKATAKLFRKIDRVEQDEISYRELQAAADKHSELADVLDYFMSITEALPAKREGAPSDSDSDAATAALAGASDSDDEASEPKRKAKSSSGKKTSGKGGASKASKKGASKGASKGSKKASGKASGKSSGKASGKASGKGTGKGSKKASGKGAGKGTGKGSNKASGKAAGKGSKKAPPSKAAKSGKAAAGTKKKPAKKAPSKKAKAD